MANRSILLTTLLSPVSPDVAFLTKATAFPARSLGGREAPVSLLRAGEPMLPTSCLLGLWSLSNDVSRWWWWGNRAGGSDKDETK